VRNAFCNVAQSVSLKSRDSARRPGAQSVAGRVERGTTAVLRIIKTSKRRQRRSPTKQGDASRQCTAAIAAPGAIRKSTYVRVPPPLSCSVTLPCCCHNRPLMLCFLASEPWWLTNFVAVNCMNSFYSLVTLKTGNKRRHLTVV